MKKQARTLIIITTAVLVLVALLLSLLFLLPKGEEEASSSDTSSDTSISLISKDTANGKAVDQPVKKAVIKTKDEEFTIAPSDDKQLIVMGYEDLPVNTTEIESLIRTLASLSASRKVADDSSKEAEFGLDKPRATAAVTYHDDSSVTFELGNDAAGDAGSYLRIEKGGPIYLVETAFSEQLLRQSVEYIGTTLITAPATKSDDKDGQAIMKSMKLSGTVRKNKPFSFGVNTNQASGVLSTFVYVITSPGSKGTSDEATTIAQAATSLSALKAVKAHPASAQLREYGLDKPYSVCELTLAVQTSAASGNEEAKPSYYNTTKHTVKLGKKDADGNYYAMVDDYKVVYAISPSSVPWAETQYNDIVSKMLFLRDIKGVKSISLKTGDKDTTFQLTHYPDEEDSDKSMAVKVDGKTCSTPEFRSLYQVLMSVYRYGETSEKPKGDAEIVLKLEPVKKSDGSFTASFYKLSSSLYICEVSDGDAYTVKTSDVKKMLTSLDNYLNGREVDTN